MTNTINQLRFEKNTRIQYLRIIATIVKMIDNITDV